MVGKYMHSVVLLGVYILAFSILTYTTGMQPIFVMLVSIVPAGIVIALFLFAYRVPSVEGNSVPNVG